MDRIAFLAEQLSFNPPDRESVDGIPALVQLPWPRASQWVVHLLTNKAISEAAPLSVTAICATEPVVSLITDTKLFVTRCFIPMIGQVRVLMARAHMIASGWTCAYTLTVISAEVPDLVKHGSAP